MPTSLATRRRKALRADLDTDSELVFYCPECADRELSEVLGVRRCRVLAELRHAPSIGQTLGNLFG